MAEDTLAKVRALLERAAHPSTPEEEARTSALIAAKLMKSSGLVVQTPAAPAPPPRADDVPPWQRPGHRGRRRDPNAAPPEPSRPPWPRAEPQPSRPPWPRAEREPSPRSKRAPEPEPTRSAEDDLQWAWFRKQRWQAKAPEAAYLILVSAYRGRCKGCRLFYEAGDEIAWRRGHGATHVRCKSYWDEVSAEGAR